MTPLTLPALTPAQAQQLYDYHNVRTVAALLGCSENPAYRWLKSLGVAMSHRGGMVSAEQRQARYAAARERGEPGTWARACKRLPCIERRSVGGNVLECVDTSGAECAGCTRGERGAVEMMMVMLAGRGGMATNNAPGVRG